MARKAVKPEKAKGKASPLKLSSASLTIPPPDRTSEHYVKVQTWRQTIFEHELFTNITQEMPLTRNELAMTEPFNEEHYTALMNQVAKTNEDLQYTAGINFFWCDPLYSPMPGIPLKTDVIENMVEIYFKSPTPLRPLVVSVVSGERPLEKRGALLAIGPEELRHAAMCAIARDITAGVDQEVLKQWRRNILSCTATFVMHSSEPKRLQAAMQLRENIANDHEFMSRTSLQRIYEVALFRDIYARNYGRPQATAQNVADAYTQVKFAKSREKISKSFVDTALTVHNRVLSIPAAEKLLLEMDSRENNPFNSGHKLQVILNKCWNSKENLLWVLHHIRHMVLNLDTSASDADFSCDGLRGSAKTGNRGSVDLILLKKDAIGYMCNKLPIQIGIEGDANWLADIRGGLRDHSSYIASKSGDGLTWRNNLSPAQARYVAYTEELLYGNRYDPHLKLLIRSGKSITAIETFSGLSEPLDDVKSLLAAERKDEAKAEVVVVESIETDKALQNLILKVLPDDGDKKTEAAIKVSELGEAERSEWLRAREYLKQQLNNYVHLIPLDQVTTSAGTPPGSLVTEAVLATPAGKFEGGTKPVINGSRGLARFVGIVWDSRVMGEVSARPSIRMPPLQIAEVQRLFEATRQRHPVTSSPDGSNPVLNQFDLYISIAGGRDLGASYQKWFQQMGAPVAVTRQVHIFVDPLSIQDRYERVRGVASNRTHDPMRLTAAPWPK